MDKTKFVSVKVENAIQRHYLHTDFQNLNSLLFTLVIYCSMTL